MDACKLKTLSGGGYDPTSIADLQADIASYIEEALGNIVVNGQENYARLPYELKKALYKIGDKYHNSQLPELVRQTEFVLENVYGSELDAYLPVQGIKNTISKKLRKIFGTVHTTEEYFEQEDLEEADKMPSMFFDKTFGSQARIKNELKQKVIHDLLGTFILDRKNGVIVTDITSANNNARINKQRLFTEAITEWAKYQNKQVPSDLQLYDNEGNYTGILEREDIKGIVMASGFAVKTPADIQQMHDIQVKNPDKPRQYDAFTSWFTLMNYDNFTKLLLGDAITIDPTYRGKFKSGNGYSYSDKHGNLITSYRTSDNISLELEINKLAQSLINSTPFLQRGTVQETGRYIKFEDFYRVLTKIKELAYNPETSRISYNILSPEVKEMPLIDKNRVAGKTLREIINSIRENPQVYGRLTFQLLTPSTMEKLGFNSEEQDKVWSIYKGIFDLDPKNMNPVSSINKIQSKYDYRAQNYYNLLTQLTDSIFSVDFLQYYENDGVIQVRKLRDQSANNIQRTLEANIGASNSRRILTDNYRQNQMVPWKTEIIQAKGKMPQGIRFQVGDIQVVLDNLRDLTPRYYKNGIQAEELNDSYFNGTPEVLKFIDEQLHLGLQDDYDFQKAAELMFANGYYTPLMELATSVYFNKYLANVQFPNIKNKKDFATKLASVYGDSENIPGFNNSLKEMSLYGKKHISIIETLANAKMITTGEAQSTQVRDAENNMLSTQTTSRLLGSLASQHERIRKYQRDINIFDGTQDISTPMSFSADKFKNIGDTLSINAVFGHNGSIVITDLVGNEIFRGEAWDVEDVITLDAEAVEKIKKGGAIISGTDTTIYSISGTTDSAVNGFSFIQPGVYRGHFSSKEYKAQMNSKQETGFTVSEFMHGAFMYDFVNGFISNTTGSKKVFGNNTVSFYPSVNSDKGTMGRIVINLNETIKTGPHAGKKFSQLTATEVDQQTAFELKQYYDKVHYKVQEDFGKLQQFINESGINIIINPDNDFSELNKYCKENKLKADEFLYNYTLKYNVLHPEAPIHLIDQTYFIKDKANKGMIMYNPTTQLLRRRYGNSELMTQFMNNKRSELAMGLLKENFSVDLFDEPITNSTVTPKRWLAQNYADWIGSTYSNNGKLTVVKITDHKSGKTYSITSKADLMKMQNDIFGRDMGFIDNPHALLNPENKLTIQVHPMLDRYNSMDYLFTQEHMIAGVGSHINHPSKAKTKPVVVWGHPAIGKSFSMENGKYSDRILDWDIEFNQDRDAWIAKQTGTIKGTKEFKNARNEYLINWRNHSDFQDFVKQRWQMALAKAQHQNKILFASPAMLMALFPKDFTSMITMSRDEFIARGKARGDANPESWKTSIDNIMQFAPATLHKITIPDTAPGKKGVYLEDLLNSGAFYKEFQKILDNEMLEESARFLAQHKRNVSYTAAMHEFQLNQIDGIPTEYNMAMIKGVPAWVYTISGDVKDDQDVFDGATFVNPLVVIWENNSLKGNKAGIDKKQFVHFYDDATGTGGIIKTAGFGITNDRARRYGFYRTLAWNMTNRNWLDADGSEHVVRGQGILEDFEGNQIDYGIIYYRKGKKHYARRIVSYNGDNTYNIEEAEVDEFGQLQEDFKPAKTGPIRSNYDLWTKLFGGFYSESLNTDGELELSEASIDMTARAATLYGIKRPGVSRVESAEDVYQPMKHSDIHYMPTDGAVKQGAANINPSSKFFEKMDVDARAKVEAGNELFKALNVQKVRMLQAGIQLDKEHHADKAVLSLMTQVISAASAKSFMPEQQNALKTALNELTKLGTKNFRNELGRLHLHINGDQAKFDAAVTEIILDTVLNSTQSDGTLMVQMAEKLRNVLGKDFTISDASIIDANVPYSSPEIFRKIVSSLTVALTKRGIKTKMPGVLSVLCPTHEIVKFYRVPIDPTRPVSIDPTNPEKGYKRVTLEDLEYTMSDSMDAIRSTLGPDATEDDVLDAQLDALQDESRELTKNIKGLVTPSPQDTQIGYKYLLQVINPETKTVENRVVRIVKPNRILKGKGLLNNPELIINSSTKYHGTSYSVIDIGYQDLIDMVNSNQIQSIKEYFRDGQDLHAYNVRFKDSEGNNFQLGDLDIVQDYFDFKDSKDQLASLHNLLVKYGAVDEFMSRLRDQFNKAWGEVDPNSDPRYRIIYDLLFNGGRGLSDKDKAYPYTADIKKQCDTFILKLGTGFLNRRMQLELNGISPSRQDEIQVRVGGQLVNVDKNTINIQSYGIIMPKVFASNLGLDPFDSIEDIKNDPLFFTRKLVQRFGTKVETGYMTQRLDDDGQPVIDEATGEPILDTVHNYDVEFKRMDGKHIYVRVGLNGYGGNNPTDGRPNLGPEIEWIPKEDDQGHLFRVDEHNNIISPMHSKNDRIFLDAEGNEIIVTTEDQYGYKDDVGNDINEADVQQAGNIYVNTRTGEEVYKVGDSGLKFYMDNLDYTTLHFSQSSDNRRFATMMGLAQASTNKQANQYAHILQRKSNKINVQRNFAQTLNDYSNVINSDGKIKGNIGRMLSQMGREMYTSFERSLNIIAARIPAQNQQSFMPMECQAFDNPNINTAYVSIFQFFLQGSDLDIDAVSLQTFDIDKNGLYQGHSPYYSLENKEMRKLSESLPFPTGLEVKQNEATNKENHFMVYNSELFGKEGSNALFILSKSDNGIMRASLNVDGSSINTDIDDDFERGKAEIVSRSVAKTNLQHLINVLHNANSHGIGVSSDPVVLKQVAEYLNTAVMGATNGETLITEQDVVIVMNQVAKAINRHNLYLKKSNPKKQESIVKNYAITQLFNIIEDPINLLEAQSSVDTVTSPVKDLSKTSPKATVQSVFTPGCVLNKFQSVNENMVGKDGISICATGLKSFFGITDMYQNILNNGTKAEKDALLFDRSNYQVKIGGKTYHGLANGFATKFKSRFEHVNVDNDAEFSQNVQDYLLEQLWEDDAANGMSAFLGLSTDNAKELVLAKINAGTSTMGMYLYGLSMGIPTNTLYRIMSSPLAFRLAELTKGDIFNGDNGKFTVLNAINYLYQEPNLTQFDPENIPTGMMRPSDYVLDAIVKRFGIKDNKDGSRNNKVITILNKYINSDNVVTKTAEIKRALKDIRSKIISNIPTTAGNVVTTSNDQKAFEYGANKIIDFLEQYIDDVNLTKVGVKYETIYGTSNLFEDIEKLAMGAEEMKLIGKNLSLNQGIKTDPAQLIRQVANLEELASKRIEIIKKYSERHPEDTWAKMYKEAKPKDWHIDLEQFLTDPVYQQQKIDDYDKIRAAYNPLKIIKTVKHYNGYFESLLNAYQGIAHKSLKWKALTEIADRFINTASVTDQTLQDQVRKNAERGTDEFLRNNWFLQNKVTIILPASTKDKQTKVFVNSNKAVPNRYQRELQLGTSLGNANFKYYMDNVVIPELKRLYPDNVFIKGLTPVLNTSTNLGIISVAYGLNINMMPKSDYERDSFNEMKSGFMDLSDKIYNNVPLQTLMYYYSMIAFDGRMGPRSLHAIFEDYNGAPIQSYRDYIAYADMNRDGEIFDRLNEYLSNDILAPVSTASRGGSNIIKVKNPEADSVEIWTPFKPSIQDQMYYEQNPQAIPKVVHGYAKARSINAGANYNYFTSAARIDQPTSTYITFKFEGRDVNASIYASPLMKNGKQIGIALEQIDPTSLPEELKTKWRQSPNAKKLAEALNNNPKTGIAEQFVIHSPEGMKLNIDLIQQILNNPCE